MLTFKEFKEKSTVTKLPLREKFYRGLIFNVGQIVEDLHGKYEILDRGTNYVTVVNESGELSKKFIDAIQNSLTEFVTPTKKFGFKGFYPTHISEDATAAFTKTIGSYLEGSITDAVAILKSIRAVDSLYEEYGQDKLEIAQSSLTRIGVWEDHQGYISKITKTIDESNQVKAVDKLKVASVIATTLGGDSSGSNPEMMVNNALRVARKSGKVNEESTKIISRMLELAKEVGIDYDSNIFMESTSRNTPSRVTRAPLAETFVKGTPVKITHDKGNVMYGLVDGIHGSVVAVKHGNNRRTFNHNYKIEKHDGKNATNKKTFADVAKAKKVSEDLGKSGSPDAMPPAPQASSLHPTDNTNRLQLTKKIQGA